MLIPKDEWISSINDMLKRPQDRQPKPARFALFFSVVCSVALLACFGCNEKEAPLAKVESLEASQIAPDFELTGIDSKTYHLSDFKGQVVVLNFWATWCGPCVLEMPSLERLHQSLKNKGLVVVTINADSPGSDAAVKKFSESYGLNFPVLRDPNYIAADKYSVTGFPETFIINRQGQFVAFKDPDSGNQTVRIISDRPWDSGNYIKELERLL